LIAIGTPAKRALVAGLDRVRGGQGAVRVDLHEGVDLAVALLDPLERGGHDLARTQLTAPHMGSELTDAHGHEGRSSAGASLGHADVASKLPRFGCDLPTFWRMSDDVQSGLEGVVAFATEIAEPDREGGALRYRGVDIEELVGKVPFEQVWGLLVDGTLEPGLPPAEPHPLAIRSGDPRVDVQSALAMLGPEWGFQSLIDIDDEEARDNLARASVMALSFVAQSARGVGRPPVPQREVDKGTSIPERFLIRWRGEADPDHVKAIDAYWISAAEHGMNASTSRRA